jgi:hypothetical protein
MAPLETDSSAMHSSFVQEEQACRARDEAAVLRADICQLRLRVEEVEEERNFNAAKANELEDLLTKFKSDYVHEELVKKSLQVAEMYMSLDKLRGKIKKLKEKNSKLKKEKVEDQKKMESLSGVVRSLQCESYDSEEEEETVLTPEKALDMTLKNMKFHIEVLEDERQKLSIMCKTQENKVAKLEKEGELKDVKVEMLEELFRSLNQKRIESPTKPSLEKASSLNHKRVELKTKVPLEKARSLHQRSELKTKAPLLRGDSTPDLFERRPKPRVNRRALLQTARSSRNLAIRVGDNNGTYTGPLIDDLPNGTGTIRFENGDTYLGEVVDGEMHGKGTMYHSSRNLGISRGTFENNLFFGKDKNSEMVDEPL